MNDPLCPLCLTLYPSERSVRVCPECHGPAGPIRLLDLADYLADADLDVVEQFWREAATTPAIRAGTLERLARLRILQKADNLTDHHEHDKNGDV